VSDSPLLPAARPRRPPPPHPRRVREGLRGYGGGSPRPASVLLQSGAGAHPPPGRRPPRAPPGEEVRQSPPLRPRSEDFLELVQRSKRGRLKLYLGFAAGVGKTYRMLEEAHALRKRGVDIVLAYIEPHARPETAALVTGLEVVPRKRVEYRGVGVEEMDLDAVLARRPQVAVVDEIPHTNAPGSRHRRRWEDVVALLDAGINVIGAMNVQHLESLKDLVESATGVSIRETVPDGFLREADQIVNLDLAVEDLLDRLRAGKIYAPEKVAHALEQFFKDENLRTLRELALREVAESLGREGDEKRAAAPEGRGGTTLGRVLVAIASRSPRADALLRRGSRIAGRLNTDWFVVFVETPEETPTTIDAETQRHLLNAIQLARDLGAEVVRLKSADPAAAILTFAREHGVGHIVLGRSRQPWWRLVGKRSVPERLIRDGGEFDVQLVADVEPERRP
jgi:two-component system, OmpR family, sensor histidine kinase KdpD